MLGLWCCTGLAPPTPPPPLSVLSAVAAAWHQLQNIPSARPDALLYFHLFGSAGPRGGANLLAPRRWQASNTPRRWHATQSERTGRRTRFSSLAFFSRQREQPLLETLQSAPVFTPSLQCATLPCQQPPEPIICSIVCPRLRASYISATFLLGWRVSLCVVSARRRHSNRDQKSHRVAEI